MTAEAITDTSIYSALEVDQLWPEATVFFDIQVARHRASEVVFIGGTTLRAVTLDGRETFTWHPAPLNMWTPTYKITSEPHRELWSISAERLSGWISVEAPSGVSIDDINKWLRPGFRMEHLQHGAAGFLSTEWRGPTIEGMTSIASSGIKIAARRFTGSGSITGPALLAASDELQGPEQTEERRDGDG